MLLLFVFPYTFFISAAEGRSCWEGAAAAASAGAGAATKQQEVNEGARVIWRRTAVRQTKEETLKLSKNAVVLILLCWWILGSACFGFGHQRWYFFLFFSFKLCAHKRLDRSVSLFCISI